MKVWEDSTKIMGRLMYDQDAGPEWVNKPPNPNEIPYSQRTVQLQYGFTASYPHAQTFDKLCPQTVTRRHQTHTALG